MQSARPSVPLPEELAIAAREVPDRPFFQMVYEPACTFAAMDRAADAWAAALRIAGVAAGSRVATMLPTSVDAVAAWFGLGRLRAVEAPLNLDYAGELLGQVLDYCRPSYIVVHRRFVDAVAEAVARLAIGPILVILDDGTGPVGDRLIVDGRRLGDAPSLPAETDRPRAEDICLMLFTSGTTGLPKGVLIAWAQISAATGVNPKGEPAVNYAVTPLFHVTSRQNIARALVERELQVFRTRFSGSRFWRDIADHGCTSAGLLANFLAYLAKLGVPADVTVTPLRYVATGRIPEAFRPIADRFGLRFATGFNMTEISPPIVSEGWTRSLTDSCGRVRPGYHCRIVDDDDREVPAGMVGELVVRADEPWVLMQGYWARPDDTVAAWRNQWFHTGDLFRRDAEGWFYFVDRKQDRIRRRGENLSPEPIENAALRYAAVAECSAFGVDSGIWDHEIKLAVVARDDMALEPAELHAFLKQLLPEFMVPRYVEMVGSLPRTATGKVRRAALRAGRHTAATWDAEAPSNGEDRPD